MFASAISLAEAISSAILRSFWEFAFASAYLDASFCAVARAASRRAIYSSIRLTYASASSLSSSVVAV